MKFADSSLQQCFEAIDALPDESWASISFVLAVLLYAGAKILLFVRMNNRVKKNWRAIMAMRQQFTDDCVEQKGVEK